MSMNGKSLIIAQRVGHRWSVPRIRREMKLQITDENCPQARAVTDYGNYQSMSPRKDE